MQNRNTTTGIVVKLDEQKSNSAELIVKFDENQPNLVIDALGNVILICHNHKKEHTTYFSDGLHQVEKIKNCLLFFRTQKDIAIKANVASVAAHAAFHVTEDEARLEKQAKSNKQ